MTDYLVSDTSLTAIANAIRTRNGTNASLEFPQDFIDAIGAIPSSGTAEKKQINFIDYDGRILYSYTAAEANALTELPKNPNHTGLIAQGWNWTLQQIKNQLVSIPDGPVWVGQMYVTASGNTEIDIELEERLSPYINIAVNGTVDVDWGDNSTHSTMTGTSLTTQKRIQHAYSASGSYTIIISVTSGSFAFYSSSEAYSLLNNNSSTSQANRVYSNAVKAVRIGNNAKIRQYGLSNLYSVQYITIPESADPSGNYILGTRSTIRSITIPSGVTAIGEDALSGNLLMTNISIPSTITTIGDYAIRNCFMLTSLTIPAGVTNVGTYALSNCRALLGVYFSSTGVTFGTYVFNMCNCMAVAKMPSGTSNLPNYAFTSNTRLTDVELPSSLTSIGSYAFNECWSLQKLTIPAGVTSIAANAFALCYGMKEYHFKRTTPPTIQSTTFNNIQSDCIIYVPRSENQSVLNAYKTANNWSSQASKMQEEPI